MFTLFMTEALSNVIPSIVQSHYRRQEHECYFTFHNNVKTDNAYKCSGFDAAKGM